MRIRWPLPNASGLIRAVAPAITLMFLTATSAAGVTEQVPVGPRAIAMGGAFTSIADDVSALFWNPAGLSRIGHQEISGARANLFGSDITDNVAAFLLPLSPRRAVAVDWYHSGFEDSELDFGENRFDLSYSQSFSSIFSTGMTVKYLTRSTALDGSSVRDGRGGGLDLGLLVTPLSRLRLGLVAQDVFDTRLNDSPGNASDVAYPRNIRAGASYAVSRSTLVAVDLDDRYHLGVEFAPVEAAALRAGFQDDFSPDEDPTWAVGAGFKVGVLRFDYAREMHPVLGSTNHLGLSMAFNFNPAQIRIEKVEARNLYASLYKTYSGEPFGSILVRNLQNEPLEARVSVFVPGFMDRPTEQQVVLRPQTATEVPVTAIFSNDVLKGAGDRRVQVQVSATYQSHRLSRTEKGSARCYAYGPGAINWGGGVAQAAAFVTMKDPVVDALAREAGRTVSLMTVDPFGNRNLSFAAALFDALGAMEVAYVPDPNNPYAAVSASEDAVDTIHYPRETLKTRTGDCDDTTVLMAALLGNVGIGTRFVDVPGHIFLLVDTGVHERNRLGLALDERRTVVDGDEVWIPLETTAIGKGFAAAWDMGAAAYSTWQARGQVELVDVTRAQARYEPADLPPAEFSLPPPGSDDLRDRVALDAEAVAGWRREYLAANFGETEAPASSAGGLNEVAHVYFLAGETEKAMAELEKALSAEPGSSRIHNNIAALLAARGDLAGAAEHLEIALAAEPGDGGIWLNLGLVHYASEDWPAADRALSTGMERCGGYLAACRLLGLPPDEDVNRGGDQKMTAEEARTLLKAALARVPVSTETSGKTGVSSRPARPGPPRTRIGGVRAGDDRGMGAYFYWKN